MPQMDNKTLLQAAALGAVAWWSWPHLKAWWTRRKASAPIGAPADTPMLGTPPASGDLGWTPADNTKALAGAPNTGTSQVLAEKSFLTLEDEAGTGSGIDAVI